MNPTLEKARRLVRQMHEGFTILDNPLSEEIIETLGVLIEAVEDQQGKLSAAEFALNYYREPQLYIEPDCSPDQPILDGGLRARTALTLMARPVKRPLPRRTPLPELD